MHDSIRIKTAMTRPASMVLAGLGAALLFHSPTAALAQSQACDVVFSVSNATTLRALQIEVDYAAATSGGFVGDDGCTISPPGIVDVVNDESTSKLGIGWADTAGFSGPGTFATCDFVAASGTPTPGQFAVSVLDHSGTNPPNPAVPAPTISVAVTGCTPVESECGNGLLESGEECDDGNLDGGDGCTAGCLDSGSCAETPETGCKSPGGARILLKDGTKDPSDDRKDQGQFQWKKGSAALADFADPVGGSGTVSWCVYENGELLLGQDVAAGAGWKATGTSGFLFKGDADGVSQIKLKAGTGKAQVQVKAKSKTGAYQSPALVLTEPVVSQLVVEGGACFEASFSGAVKNTASQYGDKTP